MNDWKTNSSQIKLSLLKNERKKTKKTPVVDGEYCEIILSPKFVNKISRLLLYF